MSQLIKSAKAKEIEARLASGEPVSKRLQLQLARYHANKNKLTRKQEKYYSPVGPTEDHVLELLTDHEGATLSYMHTLLDPVECDDVGIAIVPGGYTPASTVVQLRATGTFVANSSGDAWCFVNGPASSVNPGPDPVQSLFSKVPSDVSVVLGGCSNATSSSTIPSASDNCTVLTTIDAILCPATGLSLSSNGEARLVSAEFRVFCTEAALDRQGTGMMVRPGVWGESNSVMGNSYSGIYGQKRNEIVQAPLASLQNSAQFRMVYLPQTRYQLDWVDCPITPEDMAGYAWGVFFASGCSSGQTFRYEITWNYEINLNTLTTSVARPLSDSNMSLIGNMRPMLKPAVETEKDKVKKRPLEFAKSVLGTFGGARAKTIFQTLANTAAKGITGIFSAMGKGVRTVGPKLLSAAKPAAKIGASLAPLLLAL